MERRPAALSGLVGAVVVGGVSQAYFWRWGLDGLAGVTSSEYMWVLLTFGVAWGWAQGRVGPGVAAGALTGAGLIASYYVLQWVADGRHAAVSQFAKTGGVAWTLGAVAGGWLMGLLGALASYGDYLDRSSRLPAVAVFLVVGVGLVAAAVRRCGPAAAAQALGLAVVSGGAALAVLLVLQTTGWLYLTF